MPYKLLIVDDSKLARMSAAKALNTLYPDWSRIEAANADEALSLAKQTAFDVAAWCIRPYSTVISALLHGRLQHAAQCLSRCRRIESSMLPSGFLVSAGHVIDAVTCIRLRRHVRSTMQSHRLDVAGMSSRPS